MPSIHKARIESTLVKGDKTFIPFWEQLVPSTFYLQVVCDIFKGGLYWK